MIASTTLLKANHTAPCFFIAFGRGVFVSWAEFLVGVNLIAAARNHVVSRAGGSSDLCGELRGNSSSSDNSGVVGLDVGDSVNVQERIDRDRMERKEEQDKTLSLYQSQAAFSRNVGSLLSQILLFCLFAYRQHKFYTKLTQPQNTEENDDGGSTTNTTDNNSVQVDQLSAQVVTAILFVTSMLPLVASFIAIKYRVGTSALPSSLDQTMDYQNEADFVALTPRDQTTREECSIGIAPSNEPLEERRGNTRDELSSRIQDHRAHARNDSDEHSLTRHGLAFQPPPTNQSSPIRLTDMKYDVTALLLFQAVLVLCALRTPIISVTSPLTWKILFTTLAMTMIGATSCSYFSFSRHNRSAGAGNPHGSAEEIMQQDTSEGHNLSHVLDTTKRLKRVALYLILRHSIPSAGILSSYFYSVFRSRPFYLQIMSILGSASATISTWFYEKRLAEHFSGVSKIVAIIIVTTILRSVFSLLNIPILHIIASTEDQEADGDGSSVVDFKLWLIAMIVCVQIFGSFFTELSFLPSIILATTSIVSHAPPPPPPPPNRYEIERRAEIDELLSVGADSRETRAAETPSDGWILDDGIQYGFLISCIDFGSQLSDWTSIPLIQALDIRRENGWANLDWLVAISALFAISSLVFLRIIDHKKGIE